MYRTFNPDAEGFTLAYEGHDLVEAQTACQPGGQVELVNGSTSTVVFRA